MGWCPRSMPRMQTEEEVSSRSMQVQRLDHMFNFTFEKPANEIVAAAVKKAQQIRAKIEERVVRIQEMREQYKVTDAVLVDIINQMRAQGQRRGEERMSYTSNASNDAGEVKEVTIGAGVVNFLLTEQDQIDGEKSQVEKLETIIRNLKDLTAYSANGAPHIVNQTLTYDELKYLGF